MLEQKDNYIQDILGTIEKLPPMPENITRLRSICADPNSCFKDILPIIEKDPGFCADILHMANSAYYGVRHHVDSVQEAVRYIGFNSVVDLVSVSFSNSTVKKYFSGIKDLEHYFQHSNEIASAARCLAKTMKKNPEQQDFYATVGLLHDIGRLVIMMVSDKEIRSLIGNSWMDNPELVVKETNIFGTDHCVIGKLICEKWQFPENIQTAILRHHNPVKGGFNQDAAIILISHLVSIKTMPVDLILSSLSDELIKQAALTKEILQEARDMFTALDDTHQDR